LASFWRFSITVVSASSISLATGYCSCATDHHSPFATRHFLQIHWPLFSRRPPGPAGSGHAQTLPRWLLPSTDRRIGKDRTEPDRDDRPLSIQYVTEPGDPFGQIKLFLPTRRRSTVDHSLIARGAQCLWLRSCLADGRGRGRL